MKTGLFFLVSLSFWIGPLVSPSEASTKCKLDAGELVKYEQAILRAAEKKSYKEMALPLACILQMQIESDGFSRYLSSSFLRPLLGGTQTPGLAKDPRYIVVVKALEQLALHSKNDVQSSFIAEFSRGDWKFYTLFCEDGNTDFCSVFLPDDGQIKNEPSLLAAASILRLQKAYSVLSGPQRDLIGDRIKKLYREIPPEAALKRKFIEQIYSEMFLTSKPLSLLS